MTGRLFDHVHLVVANIWTSRRFYAAILDAVGVPIASEGNGWFCSDELYVSAGKTRTNGLHMALRAKDRETVDRFHRAGLIAGGTDNGRPGERPYHDGYYAAYLLDPDGNSVEAVARSDPERATATVIIRQAA